MIALIYMAFTTVEVYETSANGNKLSKIKHEQVKKPIATENLELFSDKTFQTITGIGGAFTESSAYLLKKMSDDQRKFIMECYFGNEGANYSLTRTHINSCDFSLGHYSYTEEEGDRTLTNFSIEHDQKYLIPMIQEAQAVSKDGFKIIASPWSAPPWMKDNGHWVGGKLLPKHEDTWAKYLAKYLNSYEELGIKIWGITVENEPLGNGNNWESMHFSPAEMNRFVCNHLQPTLKNTVSYPVKVFGFDQNREHLKEWADALYSNQDISQNYDGMAIHWYASTYEIFSDALTYTHLKAPKKHLIQTEACVDAQIPMWRNDEWYWSKNATDWGWNWAPEHEKHLHPKYAPVFRYARDIIGCLNHWVDGWIDWNMVLNRQGGPNWAKNWCTAPIIVDENEDEVYLTPLYYAMVHFSRFIRPGAKRIGLTIDHSTLEATAVKTEDDKYIVVVLNQKETSTTFSLRLKHHCTDISISARAIQTIELTI